jgi:esterase/lipase superfamily enzyme
MTDVYFATSRAPIGDPDTTDFGPDPSQQAAIIFGKAVVADASQDADLEQAVALQNLSSGHFWQALQDEIVNASVSDLLLFVHGFDNSFRSAINQAAKLIGWYGAGTPPVSCVAVALSWPSLDQLTPEGYGDDCQRADGAGDAFRQWMRALIPIVAAFRNARPGPRRVTLLTHSMGNHVLAEGLQSLLGTAPGQYDPAGQAPLFDCAILAAADEDADALSHDDKLAKLVKLVARVHVYYNNGDVPLGTISHAYHRTARLGQSGPPDMPSFRGAPYTFVNCSAATEKKPNGETADPEGHQYYREVRVVRDDICGVMLGIADDKLPNRTYREDGNYYRLDIPDAGGGKRDFSKPTA